MNSGYVVLSPTYTYLHFLPETTLTKLGRISRWWTSPETRRAPFENPHSQLSNGTGLVSGGFHHLEIRYLGDQDFSQASEGTISTHNFVLFQTRTLAMPHNFVLRGIFLFSEIPGKMSHLVSDNSRGRLRSVGFSRIANTLFRN